MILDKENLFPGQIEKKINYINQLFRALLINRRRVNEDRSKYEQLISVILEEEENLISTHRSHIDQMVEVVKQEMMLLCNIDQPGSDVVEYVKGFEQIFSTKIEEIQAQLQFQQIQIIFAIINIQISFI
ncbi:unnamed protein product [Paramecium primaurelia]|uniref:Uncharacterized protein n=1 Tax=Paramecium primaurelia TaxID=5886 RepID=A0A8S1NPS6_PARPR|nr:unnamed protein product [Paramecium primaurelia]